MVVRVDEVGDDKEMMAVNALKRGYRVVIDQVRE